MLEYELEMLFFFIFIFILSWGVDNIVFRGNWVFFDYLDIVLNYLKGINMVCYEKLRLIWNGGFFE